ncbi:hypothetical protein QNI16_17270 [Cytophagaceae bacterium YF14B1]|uniref:Uncharacterized protein n=1 Tax=Xanthocytophaga flava TaxID=3048013 RepID=A0AAE3QSW7_9BACT|nr:hypothetical protein [Xanthocytophaga flavus]MDJ1482259.1 hypothetical protein [Xanthocytophaga flavus]
MHGILQEDEFFYEKSLKLSMHILTNITAIGCILLLVACTSKKLETESTTTITDSLSQETPVVQQALPESQKPEERQRQLDESVKRDSLRFDIALKDGLKQTEKHFKADSFSKKYTIQPDDSSYSIQIDITIGHLFSIKKKHVLLRLYTDWVTYLYIYKIQNNKLQSVLRSEQGETTYIRDTIADVNGDGYKDLLVHWYPTSGCCRRNVYNVYLYIKSKGIFSKDYRFINPTFSPKEKVIRGVGYGHPGEVGLYKYKWNGLKVDTIEFIYPDASKKGKFIKTKKRTYEPTKENGIVLQTVPKEYHSIESYNWFTDF